MWSHVLRGARDLARLWVPVACPGCGLDDVRWCDECESVWWESPVRVESGAGRLDIMDRVPVPVWSAAMLAGPARGMVAAWKDSHRRDLDPFFGAVVTRTATAVAPALSDLTEPVFVVPAPARPRSTRARGIDLPLLLAQSATAALQAESVDAHVLPALRVGAGHSRAESTRGRLRATSSIALVQTLPVCSAVLLVDDVITTGATLATCVRVLEQASAVVIAGVTLASAEVLPLRAARGLG